MICGGSPFLRVAPSIAWLEWWKKRFYISMSACVAWYALHKPGTLLTITSVFITISSWFGGGVWDSSLHICDNEFVTSLRDLGQRPDVSVDFTLSLCFLFCIFLSGFLASLVVKCPPGGEEIIYVICKSQVIRNTRARHGVASRWWHSHTVTIFGKQLRGRMYWLMVLWCLYWLAQDYMQLQRTYRRSRTELPP